MQAVEFPAEIAGPSHWGSSVSFGALAEDQMLIVVLEGGLESSGDKDLSTLPPSGRVALY